ncbi:ATP-grasp domain-containing protein [Pseudomonas sp.]|uniref:ATP-grasp domain-containing protein n=1 Tax=Pseudomonas sp. TaxID=306 RepID=UPI002CF98624|nr:ATP-grasp domain-containing protein [Pseudomonas sp.]HUE91245.1 ATP-grasp domain-containing protein [Pseudomonas sp.]
MSRVKVLVFPCGSEIGLEIQRALGSSVHVELYGASSQDDHGCLAYARYYHLPHAREADFDACLQALLREQGIDLLFATHDSLMDYLAPRLRKWGVLLVNGDPDTARITRRKSSTYALFTDQPWLPRCYAGLDEVRDWPLLIKPDQGQGGQGVVLVANRAQATVALQQCAETILSEYLPGAELTVDCFTDWCRQLLHVAPRTRERVRSGIAMRSCLLPCSEEIRQIAMTINHRLLFRGPWFFQLRADADGAWKLLEVSCRLSSSSVVLRAAGVNLPLMTIQDYLQREQQVLCDPRVTLLDRRLGSVAQLDYEFDTAYLDFDDTVLLDGQANPQAMRFIYRLLAMGKRLVLVTRHAGDVRASLAQARIADSLFDAIIHLREGQTKSSCIEGRAIFVDNHFPERLEVARNKGIPVLDVDAMELFFP